MSSFCDWMAGSSPAMTSGIYGSDFFKAWYYSGAAWLSIRGGGDSVLATPAFTAD